jgi:nitrate/nitrite transporter NarK
MMLFGMKIMTFSLALRSFSCVFVYPGNVPGLGYALTLIGQIGVGLISPFFNNLPAKIAANWFGLQERELATSIAAISGPLGIAIEQLMSALIVTSNTRSGFENIPLLLFIQLLMCVGCHIWVYFGFQEHPPTPPSKSAEETQKEEAHKTKESESELEDINLKTPTAKNPKAINSFKEAYEKTKNDTLTAIQNKVQFRLNSNFSPF